MIKFLGKIEKRSNFLTERSFIGLIIISVIALVLRLIFFPYDTPVIADSLNYFWYANDINILGHLPNYGSHNDGWPMFLSLFFSMSESEKFIDYMNIQRGLTIILSQLTIIPIYLLCRKFFSKNLALLGGALFVLDPRIILNSLTGITEPIYILLLTISILLFFNSNKKIVLFSFFIVGLATIVRTEGIFLFLGLSIIYFLRFRKSKIDLAKFSVGILLFGLTAITMFFVRIKTTGTDPLFYKIQPGTKAIIDASGSDNLFLIISSMFETFAKFLIWDLVPIFILFVPLAFLLVLKSKNSNYLFIIILIIITALPVLFAYSQNALDTRYLFPIYPMFCILSLVTIKKIQEKIKNEKILFSIIFVSIIFSSYIFADYQNIDLEHKYEAKKFAQEVSMRTQVINQYFPESFYFPSIGLEKVEKFPLLKSEFNQNNKMEFCADVMQCDAIKMIDAKTIETALKNQGSNKLTHLIIDERQHFSYRAEFFKDIFLNEEKYTYLIKEFDSLEHGYEYHAKIFKIDYEIFEKEVRIEND